MVLSVNSSGKKVGVGLRMDKGKIKVSEFVGKHEADNLVLKIRELLGENGLEGKDLSGLAVVLGPGSYTGLRSGLAVVNALGWGLALPTWGVDRLRLMAECWLVKNKTFKGRIYVLLPALIKVYFGGEFLVKEGEVEQSGDFFRGPLPWLRNKLSRRGLILGNLLMEESQYIKKELAKSCLGVKKVKEGGEIWWGQLSRPRIQSRGVLEPIYYNRPRIS